MHQVKLINFDCGSSFLNSIIFIIVESEEPSEEEPEQCESGKIFMNIRLNYRTF